VFSGILDPPVGTLRRGGLVLPPTSLRVTFYKKADFKFNIILWLITVVVLGHHTVLDVLVILGDVIAVGDEQGSV